MRPLDSSPIVDVARQGKLQSGDAPMIDVERVARVLLDAMGGPGKAAAVARETVRALLAGGATIADRHVIALERAAIRLDEIFEMEEV